MGKDPVWEIGWCSGGVVIICVCLNALVELREGEFGFYSDVSVGACFSCVEEVGVKEIEEM